MEIKFETNEEREQFIYAMANNRICPDEIIDFSNMGIHVRFYDSCFASWEEALSLIEKKDKIDSFRGRYLFLSNFYRSCVKIDGIAYGSAEAAFQAQKTPDLEIKMIFSKLKAYEAKKYGRTIRLRPDWEEVKDQLMFDVCYAKFSQNPDLNQALRNTGDAELEEGNHYGDQYWGTVDGVGKNMLGKILMKVRYNLINNLV